MKRALLVFLGALGCTDPGLVPGNQVLTLTTLCPDGGGGSGGGNSCSSSPAFVGDAKSQVAVQICLAPGVTVPASGLSAMVQISQGAWDNPTNPMTPTIFQAPLTEQACVTEPFTTPATLGPVHIDAQLSGFVRSLDVPLCPAPIQSIEMVPAGTLDGGTAIGLTLTATLENAGTPTAGTALALSVTQGDATVYPQSVVLDGGTASAELIVNDASKPVTVTGVATPPTGAQDCAVQSNPPTGSLTLGGSGGSG
jgi:hypothetical protein